MGLDLIDCGYMTLFFILGREPALSAAEIVSVLGDQGQNVSVGKEVLCADVSESFDVRALMNELGGTIKIGRVLHSWDREPDTDTMIPEITRALRSAAGGAKRIDFGFSAYDASARGIPSKKINGFQKMLKSFGITMKRALEENGSRVRFVISREPTLSSVVVETNKLTTDGAEIVFLLLDTKLIIGQTLAVQPFRELSRRDFGRPARDTEGGMLPPKLARMLVNLARPPITATLLDPFCGSGTILMEAWLGGYRSLIGSDLDSTAIARTKSNLEWIDKIAAQKTRLIDIGVKNLPGILGAGSVDAIATEPYLGPPLRGRETPDDIRDIEHSLLPLFHDTLNSFRAILKSRGRAVIAFPLWSLSSLRGGHGPTKQSREKRGEAQFYHSSIINKINDYGFALKSPLPIELVTPTLAPEFGAGGKTLIYGRPDQHVWREIAILEKLG